MVGLFLLALLLRGWIVAQFEADAYLGSPKADSLFFIEWAQSIQQQSLWGRDLFVQSPLYPYLLALVDWLFPEPLLAMRILQALLGAAAWGPPTDRRGPKLVVGAMLVQWTVVTLLAFLVTAKWQFWVVAILAGTGLGAIQAASRAFMATLVPTAREAEFFGFYSLVGKTGAILGPVVFGAVSWMLGGDQRAAILTVSGFFLAGLALLARVDAGGPTRGGAAV